MAKKSKAVARRAPAESHDPETGEVTNLPDAPIRADTAGVKVKKLVTMPTLKVPDGSLILVKILEPIKAGREIVDGRMGPGGTPRMKPADVTVVEAPNGAQRNLVVGAVLKSELEESYPDHAYVGKWFMIEKFAPVTGKRYSRYSVAEIEDPR